MIFKTQQMRFELMKSIIALYFNGMQKRTNKKPTINSWVFYSYY